MRQTVETETPSALLAWLTVTKASSDTCSD
jgi:hypothetical protein